MPPNPYAPQKREATHAGPVGGENDPRNGARNGWDWLKARAMMPVMDDYERIARVIRHLDTRYLEQPDLKELAGVAGVSPFHFHRLFVRWAGVTPKDFLRCLTLNHAKQMLSRGESVLDTALASGLSGAGRLHDLCVKLESASPGELKSGGAGWRVDYGFAATPFGVCLLGQCPRGICHLSFVNSTKTEDALQTLRAQWPQARFQRDDEMAQRHMKRVITSDLNPDQPLRAFVRGTSFQLRVWRALLHIPPGTAFSYKALANALGQAKAARAVGTAIGKNPLAYLIPCHRVIRDTGVVGKYHWDTERKQAMLAWESCTRTVTRDRVVLVNPDEKTASQNGDCRCSP